MKLDREAVAGNIKDALRWKRIKIGDAERKAGVSAGYLSRWANEPDKNSGTLLDLLATVSEDTKVSIDSLLFGHVGSLTDSEKKTMTLIDKLMRQTVHGELVWGYDYALNIEGKVELQQLPFIKWIEADYSGYFVYYSTYEKKSYLLANKIFFCNASEKLKVYLLKVDEDYKNKFDVVVITSDGNYQTIAICRPDEQNPVSINFTNLIFKFVDIVSDSCSHVQFEDKTIEAIDDFLN